MSSSEMSAGVGGGARVLQTWYISALIEPNLMLFHGGLPVTICSTVHPTLQMSALRPCPVLCAAAESKRSAQQQ